MLHERHRFDHATIDGVREAARRLRPHIVQSHSVKSHALVRAAALYRSSGWVGWHHGYTATDLKMHAYNVVDCWSLRVADLAITVSAPFVHQLRRRGVAARVEIVHNVVTEQDFVARGNHAPRARIKVLSVGRLSREKGHADLLEAFARAAARLFGLDLVLVGDGPEREHLEAQARRLGIAHCVRFVGHVPDPRPWYADADLFVLPSHSEGSPNALLEAMAASLPVIATHVGGVPELVTDGLTGRLVPSRSPDALADAIVAAASDPVAAAVLGRMAASWVRTHHDPVARARRLTDLYDGLVRSRTLRIAGAA
jgi:glycosyltransferase involved in cell wall biosynthesis